MHLNKNLASQVTIERRIHPKKIPHVMMDGECNNRMDNISK
jgi:hypothetical protein